MFKIFVTAVGLFVFCSGCMTMTSYQYAKTSDADNAKKIEAKSIAFSFRRTTLTSGSGRFDPDDCDTMLKGAWAAPQQEDVAMHQFETAFGGLAKSARRTFAMGEDDCDVKMKIHLQNGWNAWGLVGAFVSGFTWTIIPCWGDDNYTLAVEASDKAGRRKCYQLTGSVTTITWLPCILGMPFTGLPGTRVNEITKENWTELRRRMVADGFFSKDFRAVAAKQGDSSLPWAIESMEYVDSTKRGTLVLRVDDENFAAARAWALTYIEELVKDKNAALRTGEARPETTYFLRDEKIDGKKLTILFETM